jgi:hypothetical protein
MTEEQQRIAVLEAELERVAVVVQKEHPIGQVKGIGLRECGQGVEEVVAELKAALAASEAARERAERERDRLIEAWPMKLDDTDTRIEYLWPKFATREAAVRAAAALDAPATGEVGG